MGLLWVWLLVFCGLALFILATFLDDREVKQFTDLTVSHPVTAARLLWLRIVTRQIAALALVLMLDAAIARINDSVSPWQQQLSRFFLGLAEAANLWQLPHYHRLIRQAVARAQALRTLSGDHS